jgi:hypothetical protein
MRNLVTLLLIAAVVLPIVVCVLVAVGAMLAAMNDAMGGAVLGRIALAAGLIWGIDLIALLLVLAVNSLSGDDTSE